MFQIGKGSRWVSWIAVCLALGALLAQDARAQFAFVTNNGSITITGYLGTGGDTIIPDTINGLPVSRIADRAFYNCATITSLTIPNSVTNLGSFTFYHCITMTNVVLPAGLTEFQEYTFYFCSGLSSFEIPKRCQKNR